MFCGLGLQDSLTDEHFSSVEPYCPLPISAGTNIGGFSRSSRGQLIAFLVFVLRLFATIRSRSRLKTSWVGKVHWPIEATQ